MATPFRLKRSAVTGKRPGLTDLEIGELALNFYDGHLFAERDTAGVGIGTTVALLTPWIEDFGGGTIRYTGVVTAVTYHGDQIVGTPTVGSFRIGAMSSPDVTDKTKDQVEEINYILGRNGKILQKQLKIRLEQNLIRIGQKLVSVITGLKF